MAREMCDGCHVTIGDMEAHILKDDIGNHLIKGFLVQVHCKCYKTTTELSVPLERIFHDTKQDLHQSIQAELRSIPSEIAIELAIDEMVANNCPLYPQQYTNFW